MTERIPLMYGSCKHNDWLQLSSKTEKENKKIKEKKITQVSLSSRDEQVEQGHAK